MEVGLVAFLQDHNGISHVVVQKLNPEVGPAGRPPPVIPPLGTRGASLQPVKKPDRSGITPEWGGAEVTLGTPVLHRAAPEDVSSRTLPTAPHRTPVIVTTSAGALGMNDQSPSPAA